MSVSLRVYSYSGIQVCISSSSGVHTFLLLPVRRISLYINSLNDQFEQHNVFDFVYKAGVIKQFLKKGVALLQSVKLTQLVKLTEGDEDGQSNGDWFPFTLFRRFPYDKRELWVCCALPSSGESIACEYSYNFQSLILLVQDYPCILFLVFFSEILMA